MVGYSLLAIGLLALAASILFASTILTFTGLGLVFWGALVFFIRPHNYVRSEMMNASGLSSLQAVDKMMVGLGYTERAVYIPCDGADKIVAFIPSEPFSRIPNSSALDEGEMILKNPDGLVVIPPGLALANLIKEKMKFDSDKNISLEKLVQSLPKVLVEELEIARDVEAEVDGAHVKFKLIDSIYADFCQQVHESSRRCGLGCPLCSALGCVLASASGKPVLLEDDKVSEDNKISETSYKILEGSRL